MRSSILGLFATVGLALPTIVHGTRRSEALLNNRADDPELSPKVFIINTFSSEGDAWKGIPEFDLFARDVFIPGLCPSFSAIRCTGNSDICMLTTGEGEINAAISMSSLLASDKFDLSRTYFLVAGVASINPKVATIGSVTFARYAVQVGLQYEIDAREIPAGFPTGYVPLGAISPTDTPHFLFGTEVFELNDALRSEAVHWANQATLNDTDDAIVYRSHYTTKSNVYAKGTALPGVVKCDSITSDVWFSGVKLADAFENYTKLMTKGKGTYCSAAQEDNAILTALFRGAAAKPPRADFGRVIVMRVGSDFDRPYWGQDAAQNLFYNDARGHVPALRNLGLAGVKVVDGILKGWEKIFQDGLKPSNYIGDILGSLGGEPEFRPLSANTGPGGSGKGGLQWGA